MQPQVFNWNVVSGLTDVAQKHLLIDIHGHIALRRWKYNFSDIAADQFIFRQMILNGARNYMAQYVIVFWRDIPTQVTVLAGRKRVRRELPERFIKSVDASAMATGAADTDAYLEEWRRSEPEECSSDLKAEADRICEQLENDYPMERLRSLISNGGQENG